MPKIAQFQIECPECKNSHKPVFLKRHPLNYAWAGFADVRGYKVYRCPGCQNILGLAYVWDPALGSQQSIAVLGKPDSDWHEHTRHEEPWKPESSMGAHINTE